SLYLVKHQVCVQAVDYHPDVRWFLQQNQALNHVKLDYVELNWTKNFLPTSVPLIIGADVLYETYGAQQLAVWLDQSLCSQGEAWICDPDRGKAVFLLERWTQLGHHHQLLSWEEKNLWILKKID